MPEKLEEVVDSGLVMEDDGILEFSRAVPEKEVVGSEAELGEVA